jgi:hypothetical protein
MNNTQEPTQEKDYFWVWIGALVATIIVVLMLVRGGEHEKYATAASAIAQDAAFSAYKDTSAYKDSALRK